MEKIKQYWEDLVGGLVWFVHDYPKTAAAALIVMIVLITANLAFGHDHEQGNECYDLQQIEATMESHPTALKWTLVSGPAVPELYGLFKTVFGEPDWSDDTVSHILVISIDDPQQYEHYFLLDADFCSYTRGIVTTPDLAAMTELWVEAAGFEWKSSGKGI